MATVENSADSTWNPLLGAEQVGMTHKECVRRATQWLRASQNCAVVIAERRVVSVTEQPDVLGWHGAGQSVLVECKVSRADFLADRNKLFRRYEDSGVGEQRYFALPKGILALDDLPEGWGWLEIHPHCIRIRRQPTAKTANKAAETAILVSCIRRLEMAATVFVRPE